MLNAKQLSRNKHKKAVQFKKKTKPHTPTSQTSNKKGEETDEQTQNYERRRRKNANNDSSSTYVNLDELDKQLEDEEFSTPSLSFQDLLHHSQLTTKNKFQLQSEKEWTSSFNNENENSDNNNNDNNNDNHDDDDNNKYLQSGNAIMAMMMMIGSNELQTINAALSSIPLSLKLRFTQNDDDDNNNDNNNNNNNDLHFIMPHINSSGSDNQICNDNNGSSSKVEGEEKPLCDDDTIYRVISQLPTYIHLFADDDKHHHHYLNSHISTRSDDNNNTHPLISHPSLSLQSNPLIVTPSIPPTPTPTPILIPTPTPTPTPSLLPNIVDIRIEHKGSSSNDDNDDDHTTSNTTNTNTTTAGGNDDFIDHELDDILNPNPNPNNNNNNDNNGKNNNKISSSSSSSQPLCVDEIDEIIFGVKSNEVECQKENDILSRKLKIEDEKTSDVIIPNTSSNNPTNTNHTNTNADSSVDDLESWLDSVL